MQIPTIRNIASLLAFLFILKICNDVKGSYIDGYIFHETDHTPVSNARITIKTTHTYVESDESGYFQFNNDFINTIARFSDIPVLDIQGNLISVYVLNNKGIRLYNIQGKIIHSVEKNDFHYSMQTQPSGIYFLHIETETHSYKTKIILNANNIFINYNDILNNSTFTLVIEKDGYLSSEIEASLNESYDIILRPSEIDYNLDFVQTIENLSSYEILAGNPLNSTYSDVSSMKFVYQIDTKEINFLNTKKHTSHFGFCRDFLDYNKGIYFFNEEQYKNNSERKYFLGSVDYFASSKKYILQFFASDDITCEQIQIVFNKIINSTYFDDDLFILPNAGERQSCNLVPVISIETLFNGQNYQCLNPEETYGYLKKVPVDLIKDLYIGKHDILLIDGTPINLPVVSGIITTVFQPVLSHINVLSHNRGTPNMALKNGWLNNDLTQYIDQLVYLKVGYDHFTIRKANIDEAENFWNIQDFKIPIKLNPNYSEKSLLDINELNIDKVEICGGKAANFGELNKVETIIGKVELPKRAFAIPIYFYDQHIKQNGLDTFIVKMLSDHDFSDNIVVRKEYLKTLRKKIKDAPLSTEFYNMVYEKLSGYEIDNFRFRSSTNAEDIAGFNGAGLYDSKTGILDNNEKSIEEAIKKVWASLWNFNAFEERAYFKIDQESVAMGILVHESFPDEVANGVVITKNLYNVHLKSLTINSQFGEISVVNPEEGFLPEQVLYYEFEDAIEYINLSNVPSMESQNVLTKNELDTLATYCRSIEIHYNDKGYNLPLDIEFKIIYDTNNKRKVVIKQCRFYNN